MSTQVEEKPTVYFLFSRLFRKAPDPPLLNKIEPFFEETDLASKAEIIAVEYTSLFVAPGDYYIPPYESFYCDTLAINMSTADSPYFQPQCFPEETKGFLYGSSTRAVEKAYRKASFEIDANFHDLPDHLACELEFMGRLYENHKFDEAKTFFEKHLGRWSFEFLQKVEMQTESIFYQKAATSLKQFLNHETQSFKRSVLFQKNAVKASRVMPIN
ncbi:MAG: molecular chaperone TorD family protein [Candidatus Omnitrophica bacterium]|nr:molecular chaperone TorD family protein [Candidatus Omnitrophota bacterium]